MRDANVGFLPVCDRDKHVIGTVTDHDLALRVLADGLDGATPIEQVLTRECVCCSPEDELTHAAQRMAEEHKSRIMCVDDDGMLIGVISLSDIAQYADGAQASHALREISEREARA
jgi:CBS domain-containing protein